MKGDHDQEIRPYQVWLHIINSLSIPPITIRVMFNRSLNKVSCRKA